MSLSSWCPLVLALTLAGCGGAQQSAESAPAPANPEPSEEAAEAESPAEDRETAPAQGAGAFPTDCFKDRRDPCLPDPKFVKRMCNDRHPGVALALFANPTFTRGYLTRKTEAWNASGGASPGGFVEFDEEVLLLFERKADAGGLQVSGAGASYDALRWDGYCVTLSGEEVTRQKPPKAKTPLIEWRYLDDDIQEALRKDEAVNSAYRERRTECKGASSGDVSLKCVKADAKLSQAIVAFVRGGGSLPVPSKLP